MAIQMIDRFQRLNVIDLPFQRVLRLVFRIRVDAEDLAKICFARLRQQKTIGFRRRVRLFVRVDVTCPKRFQPNTRHESAANERLPVVVELLVININRWIGLGLKHSLLRPISQESRSADVAVPVTIARLIPIENKADDICWVSFVQFVLQFWADNVVRWCNHIT